MPVETAPRKEKRGAIGPQIEIGDHRKKCQTRDPRLAKSARQARAVPTRRRNRLISLLAAPEKIKQHKIDL